MRLERDGLEGQSQGQLRQQPANGPASGQLGDERLSEQAEQSRPGANGFAGQMGGRVGGAFGGMGGMGGGSGGGFGSGTLPSSTTAAGIAVVDESRSLREGGQQASHLGLASLDVSIPTRGREYLFTTPRGDLLITAEAVEERLVDRCTRLGLVVATLLGAWLLVKIGGLAWRRLGPRVGGPVLIVLGVASMLSFTLPLVGVFSAAFGVVTVIRSFRRRVVAVP